VSVCCTPRARALVNFWSNSSSQTAVRNRILKRDPLNMHISLSLARHRNTTSRSATKLRASCVAHTCVRPSSLVLALPSSLPLSLKRTTNTMGCCGKAILAIFVVVCSIVAAGCECDLLMCACLRACAHVLSSMSRHIPVSFRARAPLPRARVPQARSPSWSSYRCTCTSTSTSARVLISHGRR
jgi:hypothetical protein